MDRGFTGVEHFETNFPSPLGGTIHAEVYVPAGLGPGDRVPVLAEVSPYTTLEFRQLESPVGPGPQSTALITEYVERGYAVAYVDAPDEAKARDRAFAEWLNREGKLTGVPGGSFFDNAEFGRTLIRFHFAVTGEKAAQAEERLAALAG